MSIGELTPDLKVLVDAEITAAGPGGGAISVTDGSTTVDPATSVEFPSGTVTDAGGGVAQVATGGGSQSQPVGPITVTVADVPNDQDTFEVYTPVDGALIYDILFSVNPQWNQLATADLYDGDPNTGMSLGAEGNTDYNAQESEIDDFGGRAFISLNALTGGAYGDNFPYVSTGEPITLRMTYGTLTANVTAVNQGTKTFSFDNYVGGLNPGDTFTISGSTGNDGTYTVVDSTGGAGFEIVVVEAIPNATGDGMLSAPTPPTVGETQFIIDDRGVPVAP